jgi:hypothetical protein
MDTLEEAMQDAFIAMKKTDPNIKEICEEEKPFLKEFMKNFLELGYSKKK